MTDPLQDPVNSPAWYEREIGEQVDHAYGSLVADCVEKFPTREPATFPAVPSFITWGCGTCGKWRSAPCAPSCVFGGQGDPVDFKRARVESERREDVQAAMRGEWE